MDTAFLFLLAPLGTMPVIFACISLLAEGCDRDRRAWMTGKPGETGK